MKHSYDLVNSFLKMKSVSHYSNSLFHLHSSRLITSLKLKEVYSASKRPMSKDNTSWTVQYLNYCHYHVFFLPFISIFFQACPLVSNNTVESPGYPSYYSHRMDCNVSVPIPLGATMRVFFHVFDIGGYNYNCR